MIVLVVDDEPSILTSTKTLLETMGHTVHTTAEAGKVVDLITRHRPDVLLQDVRMPGLDLRKLLAAVRSIPEGKAVRVALFSAGMDLDQIAAAADVDRVLEKPFTPRQLEETLLGH